MSVYTSPGVYPREIDLSNIIPNIATTSAALVGYSAKGDTSDIQLITNTQQFIEEYGKPDISSAHFFHETALAFLQQGKVLYCLRVENDALFGGVIIPPSTADDTDPQPLGTGQLTTDLDSSNIDLFGIFGKDPGTWNNDLAITISNVKGVAVTTADASTTISSFDEYTFNINVYVKDADGVYQLKETWNVSRKTKLDARGAQLNLETKINGFSKYITVTDDTTQADTVMPVAYATAPATGGSGVFTGGTNGDAITDADLTGADDAAGWDAFTNTDNTDIRILLNGGEIGTEAAVQLKMKTVAEARKDCIAILDVPRANSTSGASSMASWRNATQNFNSSYTALYGPWVRKYDTYSDSLVYVPPSGYVGAQFAYNDYVSQPWFPPAGLNRGLLGSVVGAEQTFTEGERDTMYEAGINPIQVFRGEGIAIWGQKTQQTKASALDRVNVRRLLIVIEKAVSVAMRSYLFELNSELTRFRVTAQITEYLDLLSSQGAFQTEAGDDGFSVICNTTNNTPAVIDANQMNVDLFIKPARSIEYIQLSTIVTTSGVSFEELISKGSLI